MKLIIKNKDGLYNNEVIETWKAGMVLTGPEVKSIKAGQISLKGSFIQIDNKNEIWLTNCHISPYKPAKSAQNGYNPTAKRKLLLNKKEINSILGKKTQKGLTIIPISVYTNKRLIKVDIGLVRNKTKKDKREIIKKRQLDREIKQLVR